MKHSIWYICISLIVERLPTIDIFNYLGLTLQGEGRCEKYVTNRSIAGRRNRWSECKLSSATTKFLKYYRTMSRQAMANGGSVER